MDELIASVLSGRATPEEAARVIAWRRSSAAAEASYQQMVALWHALGAAESPTVRPPPDPQLLIGLTGVRSLHGPQPTASRARGTTRRALAAAAAATLLAMGYYAAGIRSKAPGSESLPDEFVAGRQEATTARLSDGTIVRLAPESRLRLTGQRGGRDVWLDGRGYFAVSHRDSEPFRIRTVAGEVAVLGTRFDVEVDRGNLRIVVVEGRVALTAGDRRIEVGAGEMGMIRQGTALPPIKVGDVLSMVDWVGDFLAFQSTPLSTAALEIGRRFGVRVVVTDSALTNRTITTSFMNQSLEEVLQVVCAVALARCTVHQAEVRIEPR
jgi:ferric-dicitrate binding protein FerR (iron transport regulator)